MPSLTNLKFPSSPTRPQQPPAPCPWLWRCHQCHILYRLATTRRCLECDHEFCLTAPSAPAAANRKRKRGGPCKAEFDYVGWAAHGAWRRTVCLNGKNKQPSLRHNSPSLVRRRGDSSFARAASKPASGSEVDDSEGTGRGKQIHDAAAAEEGGVLLDFRRWVPASSLTTAWGDEYGALEHGAERPAARFAEKKEALFVRRRHDCWLHCDFPSECHHAVYKAQQEGRPVLARARAVDEVYVRMERAGAAAAGGRGGDGGGDGGGSEGGGPSGLRQCSSQASGLTLPGLRGPGWGNLTSVMESDDDDDEESLSSEDGSGDGDGSVSPCSSPPPPLGDVIGKKEPVSPILLEHELDTRTCPSARRSKDGFAAVNPEGDYSYETFKRTAPVASPVIHLDVPTLPALSTGNLEFEIYVDQDNQVSPPVSPFHSSATADPIPIPGSQLEPTARVSEGGDDFNAFLASLYTTSAQHRLPDDSETSHPAAPTPAREDDLLLHSFTPYESFRDVPRALHRRSNENDDKNNNNNNNNNNNAAAADAGQVEHAREDRRQSPLEQAYSDQAWFPDPFSSSSPAATASLSGAEDPPRSKSRRASRAESAGRMLTLISRRTSLPGSPPQPWAPALPATGADEDKDEDWDYSSDSSDASSSSTSCSSSSSSSSSSAPAGSGSSSSNSSAVVEDESSAAACHRPAVLVDGDGDSIMLVLDEDDGAVSRPRCTIIIEEEEEGMSTSSTSSTSSSSLSVTTRPLEKLPSDGDDDEQDLVALYRMRNAFMRGDI